MGKPRIFLGTSGKQAKMLQALTRGLEDVADVQPWTSSGPAQTPLSDSVQASPRDNVVFEAGLFGGVLGMRRTFILHATGSKLPSDLLGLTCVRYGDAATAAEMRVMNEKLRKAIETE